MGALPKISVGWRYSFFLAVWFIALIVRYLIRYFFILIGLRMPLFVAIIRSDWLCNGVSSFGNITAFGTMGINVTCFGD